MLLRIRSADDETNETNLLCDFPGEVAPATSRREKTKAALANLFDLYPHLITAWTGQLQEDAAGVFGKGTTAASMGSPPMTRCHSIRATPPCATPRHRYRAGATRQRVRSYAFAKKRATSAALAPAGKASGLFR